MVEDNSPPVVVTINKDNIFKFPDNFDDDGTITGADGIYIET
jgi:hypothetical protein